MSIYDINSTETGKSENKCFIPTTNRGTRIHVW